MVSVRGHPFERDPFEAIFQDMASISVTFVDQPASVELMTPKGLAPYQALVLYDMPGIDFAHGDQPGFVEPPDALVSGLTAALDRGIGVLALHHAIAGWPAWPDYGEWLGGKFCYRPMEIRGKLQPDSGYRHDITHMIHIAKDLPEPLSPLLTGLPETFELTDELYLAPVLERDVFPLLRSDYTFTEDNFHSASRAVRGDMFSRKGWAHPPGSNLVGWVKRARNSPLVYLQPGDGPATYANPQFRKLVENALRWAASDIAHDWASQP
ncbi:MAG: ThuA domain-containing protein [Pseudomonadota bacterium]